MGQTFHKIRARTLHEAYRAMRERYGLDALVISTQTVTEGGFFGLFGQQMVEVTVSVANPEVANPRNRRPSPVERKYTEHQPPASPPDKADAARLRQYEELVREAQRRMNGELPAASPVAAAPKEDADAAHTPHGTPPELRGHAPVRPPESGLRREPDAAGAAQTAPVLPFPKSQPAGATAESLRREVQEMRDMLQVLYAENPGAGLPTEFATHYRLLVNRGVSRKVAAQIIAAAVRNADLDVLRNTRILEERLKLEIRRRVPVSGGIAVEAGACRTVALCGPTGVGKTTSLAKLAALFAVRERARVATVTADTYRIAAPEQLRVYANIVGVPLRVANDADQMRAALDAFRDYDLVFIDTAGSSQFNLEQISELKTILDAAAPCEVILTLGANTQLADLRNVVSNFKCLNPTSILFTKVDETRQYGAMLSILAEADLPLSYLSTGQNVPDDIRVAASATVANLIMEGREPRG